MSSGLRVVVFGSTGTAGRAAVRESVADDRVAEVRAITRRDIGISHPKLREVRCADFADLTPIADVFEGVDACFFCLGISQGQAENDAHYRAVTLEYPLAAARMLKERSPKHAFHYVSGNGADPSGKSWWMWARVKGEAENQLNALGLQRVFCIRPGYIHPEPADQKPGAGAAVGRVLFPVMNAFSSAIRSADLARAMIELTLSDAPSGLYDNRALLTLAAKHPSNQRP